MANRSMALVVGASGEEFAQVDHILPDLECASLLVKDNKIVVLTIPVTTKVIVAFAQEKEEDTIAVCEHIRSFPEISKTPILLIINRYQITHGNAVKRMGKADFVIAPIREELMRNKFAKLVESS